MSRRSGPPSPSPAPSRPADAAWPVGWICALVFVAVLVAYWPALSGGFIWDDSGHVTRPDLRSLGGLGRIWCEFGATQQYYPVLHSAFWFEHALWGDAPVGYHLLNVLLHASAACLFGILLRRLMVPGAWLAALLFALHPVCVESVAWISEQKNTLSLLFYLGAALTYLRFDAGRDPRRYALASGLFVLALLTKTVTASLPAALLVVFWWQRGRLDWRRDVLPLLPWFVLGAGSGLVTAHFERTLIGAQGADFNLDWVQRGLLAGRVSWFYLGKLLWPADLIFIYPHWTIDAAQWWQWLFPGALVGVVAGLAGWSCRHRAPLAALLLFAGTLFPVLGFVNVYPFVFSYVADHFQYLASLAIFALAAAGLCAGLSRLPRAASALTVAALLAVLGTLTWQQAATYRDVFTLYESTLQRNPECWMAHNNLAMALTGAGRVEEAVPHLEQALRLRPEMAEALSNLGDDLTKLGHPREGIPHLEHALRLQPGYAEAHNNLGSALMASGQSAAGIAQFEEALRLRPGYAIAHDNLGLALASSGRTAEALTHFEQAARLDPTYADAELNWAIGLTLSDRFPEAVAHFEKALQLAPASAQAHFTYARALAKAGRNAEAAAHLEEARRLDPTRTR